MAFDAFLKIEGIEGECRDEKHDKEIELISVNWNITQPQAGTKSSAGSLSASRATCSMLTVTKAVDLASPVLYSGCANAKHYNKATVTVCRAGGGKEPYYIIKLKDVSIPSVHLSSGASSVEALLTEVVTLNYGEIEVEYKATDPTTGKPTGRTSFSYSSEVTR